MEFRQQQATITPLFIMLRMLDLVRDADLRAKYLEYICVEAYAPVLVLVTPSCTLVSTRIDVLRK